MKNLMPKTDCRDCLFYDGESCKLPFFSNHKTNLSDYCINFEPKRRKRHLGTTMAKEIDCMFQHTKKPSSLQTMISNQD